MLPYKFSFCVFMPNLLSTMNANPKFSVGQRFCSFLRLDLDAKGLEIILIITIKVIIIINNHQINNPVEYLSQ